MDNTPTDIPVDKISSNGSGSLTVSSATGSWRQVSQMRPALARGVEMVNGKTQAPYDSPCAVERTWSDGSIDFICSVIGCGYTRSGEEDRADYAKSPVNSIGRHWKIHTRAMPRIFPEVAFSSPESDRASSEQRLTETLEQLEHAQRDLQASRADYAAIAERERVQLDTLVRQAEWLTGARDWLNGKHQPDHSACEAELARVQGQLDDLQATCPDPVLAAELEATKAELAELRHRSETAMQAFLDSLGGKP